MAEELSKQLEELERERVRLEELLMLDTQWRALRQLEMRAGGGDAETADRKAKLVEALGRNRIFAARSKVLDAIAAFAAGMPPPVKPAEAISLTSRIVTLSEPTGEAFRARLRVKTIEPARVVPPEPSPPAAASGVSVASVCADALQLIDGLGRSAVEILLDAGVCRFADIAAWTREDVAFWSTRLDGLAHGTPGSWIEQAAMLATGKPTAFAGRVRRGEYAALVPPPQPEAARLPPEIGGVRAIAAAVTADELIATLDRVPGARRRADRADAVDRSQTGYVRPRDIARGRVESAASERIPDERHAKLGQRLKALQGRERLGGGNHAAYRGIAEEASVTIVTGNRAAPDATSVTPDDDTSKPSSNRFLLALTGKG